jgi:hypothetical protein
MSQTPTRTTRVAQVWGAVLPIVLAFATSASGECAWVLWQNDGIVHGDQAAPLGRTIVVAFDDRISCETLVSQFLNKAREDPSRKVAGRGWTFTSPDGKTIYAPDFQCLPDTVDPRGPKGK